MSASVLFVQLDKVPTRITTILGNPWARLCPELFEATQNTALINIYNHDNLPCTLHQPVIIVAGVWDSTAYTALPSRLFKWLQEARKNQCPMFGFGFANRVMNSAFGGLNLRKQRPGLKTVYTAADSQDFLTSAIPSKFNSWSICNTQSCTPPKSATILATTQQDEPMLIKFNERTYSTPLSLSLGWSGIVLWLHHHPDSIKGNEQLLEHRFTADHGAKILACFLTLWAPHPYCH